MKVFRAPLLAELDVACVVRKRAGVIAIHPGLSRAAVVAEICRMLPDARPDKVHSWVHNAVPAPLTAGVGALLTPNRADAQRADRMYSLATFEGSVNRHESSQVSDLASEPVSDGSDV